MVVNQVSLPWNLSETALFKKKILATLDRSSFYYWIPSMLLQEKINLPSQKLIKKKKSLLVPFSWLEQLLWKELGYWVKSYIRIWLCRYSWICNFFLVICNKEIKFLMLDCYLLLSTIVPFFLLLHIRASW